MRVTLALFWLASLASAQAACNPQWAPNEFPLAGVNGSIDAMTTFDDGSGPGFFVGGSFTVAGSFAANNVAKWDGSTWSAAGAGLNGWVHAFAVYDDGSGPALYAGGQFTGAGSAGGTNVARWNGSTWSAIQNAPLSAPAIVFTLAVYDDGTGATLVAGGSLGIAAWDGASWSTLGLGVNGAVRSLAVVNTGPGPRLYAAGTFGTAGTVQADKIACWDGTAWSNLGTGPTMPPYANLQLAAWDDGVGQKLYVGGDFTMIAGFYSDCLARWNGSAWLQPPSPLPILLPIGALAALPDGAGTALYAVIGYQAAKLTSAGWSWLTGLGNGPFGLGSFNSPTGPVLCARGFGASISQWTGSAWGPMGSGLNGAVQVVASLDDGTGPALYAGGRFLGAGGVRVNGVAKRTGSSWTPLGTGLTALYSLFYSVASVEALAAFDSGAGPHVYAGGSFASAGGVPASNIAKWNGSAWSALGSGVNGVVQTMTVGNLGNGPRLFVGGGFPTAGGVTVNHVAEWNGASWSALGNGITNPGSSITPVRRMIVHDDGSGPALYVGGSFSSAGGIVTGGLARWNGSSWGSVGWSGQSVEALAIHDDGSGPALYAADGGGGVKKWNGVSWAYIGSAFFGPTFALTPFDDGTGPALYATGNTAPSTSLSMPGVARWNGASWSTAGNPFTGTLAGLGSPGIRSLATADGGGGLALYAGGDFLMTNGEVSAGVARWMPGGPPVLTAQPVTQAIDPGATLTLSVTAKGSTPLTYQWRRDGVWIPGAVNPTLAIQATTPGDVASYDVKVWNPCGQVTSQPAWVAVYWAAFGMAQPQGAGSLLVTNSTGIPGSSYFSAFTFDSANIVNPGNGAWLGLHIPYPELVSQFLIQTPPFVGVLDANGGSAFALPAGAIAPWFSGTRVFAVTAIYDPIALTLIGGSGLASLLLQ